MNKIVLIDGNSLMFRAYYATAYTGNLMQTASGIYTNALFGFVNMMNKILETEGLTHIFVAFDKDKKTFRHQAYQDYKGGRAKMPDELGMQIHLIKEYIDILGIKQYETENFEADDLIATMANRVRNEVDEILVISGDKDLLQLVDEKVTVALTKKGVSELEYYRVDNFKDLMGILPTQLTDYKGLIGDSSDNLPGVSGVGPKTAQKLLGEYHTLENIFENASNIKGKLGEMLVKDQEISLRTKFLATLSKEADLPYHLDDVKYHYPEYDKLRSFYEKVEFKSFIKKMNQAISNAPIETVELKQEIKFNGKYYINDIKKLEEIIANQKNKTIPLEIEYDQENYHKAKNLGLAFIIDETGFYFEEEYLSNEIVINFLKQQEEYLCVDVKKIYCGLLKHQIRIDKFGFDLLLASYILNPNYPTQDLHNIFNMFVKTNLPYFDEIYGKKTTYQIPEIDVLARYALDKCYLLKETKAIIDQQLTDANQIDLLYKMEIPLAIILGDIEMAGFKVDKEKLLEIGEAFQKEINDLEQKIYESVGHEFNIGSPKQLGNVLFEELKLGKGKKNKTGYSTSADVLEQFAKIHEVPRMVLEYRKYTKLYSTYVVGLINELGEDQKVHTTFKQFLTQTGRLSSTEPNIQNIPIRTETGRMIRSAFVPSTPDGYLVSADYSQIELRILAALADCQLMINDFNAGKDLHSATASKIYELPEQMVTKEMRRVAKAVNFGIIYGMSDWGLADQLGISQSEANHFINRYFKIYPEIKTYLDKMIEDAKAKGYSETIFHRRRYMNEINSSNATLRKFAERTAMNAPIQGAAADIIKYAMINVDKTFKKLNIKSKIVVQVHDELIIDCLMEEVEIVKQALKKAMEEAVTLKTKLDVDVEWGKTWDLK